MKLSYYCNSCKKENYIKTKTSERYSFFQEYGSKEINERCSNCGNFTKKDINRLHAEPNNYLIIGGIVMAIIFTVLLWDIGYISTLTAGIPFYFWINENKKTSFFNRSRVR